MKHVSLRGGITALAAAIVLVAIGAGLSLVEITRLQRGNASTLHAAINSIHLVEGAEVNLLAHDRARQGIVRAELASEIRDALREAERSVTSADEGAALRATRRSLEDYLANPAAPDKLDVAFRDLERLIELNIVQAEAASASAAWWDRTANWIAGILAGTLVVLAGVMVVWLRRSLVRPVLSVTETLEAFAAGDHEIRAQEIGPEELRVIAQRFNDMASAIARQRANQLTFVAGVAHDLRNPLSVLRMSLDITDADGSPDRAAQVLPVVRRQIDRLERMLGDLVDATRIEAGKVDIRPHRIDLRLIARQAHELYASASRLHRFRLVDPPDPVYVEGDDTRLLQVVGNLVNNAVKYSPSGGEVTVTVRTEGNAAILSVADEGIGITESERRTLFEPFRRSGSLRDQVPGVGLGLSVARKILSAHGGSIDVRSAPGKGSTFEIRLPLAPAPHAPSPDALH